MFIANRRFRRLWAVCLAMMMTAAGTVRGQFEPVVVVTVSSIDDLLGKVNHLASLAGVGHMTQMVQMMAGTYTMAIDKSRPLTIAVLADDQSFQTFGVIPIADLATWLKSNPLGASAVDLGDGIYQIQLGPRPAVIQSDGNGWVYLAQSADDLKNKPSDPLDLADGLDADFDVAVRAYVQNIPVGVRDNMMAQYRNMAEMGMQRLERMNSPQAQFQRANMERQLKSMQRMSEELDQFTVGLSVNQETEKVVAETRIIAVRGTRLARQIDAMAHATTRFAGFFVPKATMTMSYSSPITQEDAADQIDQLEAFREMMLNSLDDDDFQDNAQAKQKFIAIANELADILKEVLQSGELDTAGAAMVADGKLNLVGATNASVGSKLESIVTEIGELTKQLGTNTEVRLGFGDHEGVTFHAAQFELPPTKELANAFGDKLVIYIGSSDDNTYFGLGEKSLGAIRKAITSSNGPPKAVQPMRILVSVGDILDFAANVTDEEQARQLAHAFREAGADDQISVSSTVAQDGAAVTRIEVQEGVISSFGHAYAARVGMGGAKVEANR